MNSNNRCIRVDKGILWGRKYSSGLKACMLAVRWIVDYEMNRIIKHLCLFAALTAALCGALAGAADQTQDSAQAKAKLAEVRGRIAALTGRLGGELKQRDSLNARLRDIDLGITAKRQRLEGLRSAEVVAEHRRGELRAEAGRVKGELDGERAALAAQVRAAYMMGQQEHIKLLLNQDDPSSAGRMAAYYAYFARERSDKIAEIRDRVDRLQELQTQADQATDKLHELQGDAARQLADLQRARQDHTQALAAVTREVGSGSEELKQLKREEQAEESLIADLTRVLQDFPVDTQESFQGLRGRLPWPVSGKIAAHYQESRTDAGQSGSRWNGVLIETAPGAKVRAPYFGRVVYADWLQGLGLLLIIGHKGDYMTLYGHAEVLYKSVGDWVSPGDVIAGMSDAGSAPQLYFEIREGRTPKDPKAWLKAGP
jgi:murein hydrolase activator